MMIANAVAASGVIIVAGLTPVFRDPRTLESNGPKNLEELAEHTSIPAHGDGLRNAA